MTILKEIVESRRNTLVKDHGKFKFSKKLVKNPPKKTISKNIKDSSEISIISEIKPSSPTLGKIREKMDIKAIAKQMESSGVIGLSVLTEPEYFHGTFENLKIAVETTNLPCLMKDFVIDELQFQIANQLGATNILLINYICDLADLFQLSLEYKLEPLIEIHSIEEINDIKHLIEIGFNPKLIGVNNRNLKTLKINLNNSKKIIPELRKILGNKIKIVSESGINTINDIELVTKAGANAVLIGSSIMKSKNIKEKILSLRGII